MTRRPRSIIFGLSVGYLYLHIVFIVWFCCYFCLYSFWFLRPSSHGNELSGLLWLRGTQRSGALELNDAVICVTSEGGLVFGILRLSRAEFTSCLQSWARESHNTLDEEVVALDHRTQMASSNQFGVFTQYLALKILLIFGVAIISEQYKNIIYATWSSDSTNKVAIWAYREKFRTKVILKKSWTNCGEKFWLFCFFETRHISKSCDASMCRRKNCTYGKPVY